MTPTALLNGKLIETDGCLWVIGPSPSEKNLPIWPDSYVWDEAQSGIADGDGIVLASPGDEVSLGGGLISLHDAVSLVGDDPIPAECRVGGYWTTGSIESP